MPAVSIVMPVYEDEEWVTRAIESCFAQTYPDIEIVCVDDASTDGTCAAIERLQAADSRIKLIRQNENRSAFQARRVGIQAATSPYIMFLDGDDELAPHAVATALGLAQRSGADLVGFGVEVVSEDGRAAPRFERTLQPKHRELVGPEILAGLFPAGQPAQGHLWRYLFATSVLKRVYEMFPSDLQIYRANDLPVTFLAAAHARKYVSTEARLYRYAFGRGTSGHVIDGLERFRFYLSAVDSVDSLGVQVGRLPAEQKSVALPAYDSARLWLIGGVLSYCATKTLESVRAECVELLVERVGVTDLVRAATAFFPETLPFLARELSLDTPLRRPVRNVLLTSANLSTGGVQGVLAAQARYLLDAGFGVVIAIFGDAPIEQDLPDGLRVERISGAAGERLDQWLQICDSFKIDAIFDHHVLYNRRWPFYALAARSRGIPTFGWLHNFALRPALDQDDRNSFLVQYLGLLEHVIVLSKTDVTYWKTQGVEQAVYLPNPPSPVMRTICSLEDAKSLPNSGPFEIVWWGRLQQSTKQVRQLIAVAAALRERGVDFHMTIAGPDGPDLSRVQLAREARRLGVRDVIALKGALRGQSLAEFLAQAHLFVSTSVIEGFPLTFLEAQAAGLPIAMFELPWLAAIEDNDGVVSVPQGDVAALADVIGKLTTDRDEYGRLSAGSLKAAEQALMLDFPQLYSQLLSGNLPARFSPPPSLDDVEILLRWASFYAERNGRIRIRTEERLSAELAHARGERDALAAQLRRSQEVARALRLSAAFRIGRAATWFPRYLRSASARLGARS